MSLKLVGSGQPVVPDKPQAMTDANRPLGANAVLNGRPVRWAGQGWGWQSEKSFQQLESSGKLNRPWWRDPVGAIRNELRHMGNQARQTDDNSIHAEANRRMRAAAPPGIPLGGRIGSELGYGTTSQTANNISAAMTVGVVENAQKFSEALRQRVTGGDGNPEGGRVGNLIERVAETGYQLMGATPPGRQNEFEQSLDATVRSASTSIIGTAVGAKIIPALGSGLAGAALTGGARWALGEMLSTYLDDNRGGNLFNLVGALTGNEIPLSVDIGNDDWIDAATKSLIPNALPGEIISALGGAGQLARNPGAFAAGMKNTRRWLRSQRTVADISDARTRLERGGITQTDPATGATSWRQAEAEFKASIGIADDAPAPAAAAPSPEGRQIPAIEGEITTENFARTQPAPLPQVEDVSVDPWSIRYDPELPEADVALNLLRELSDEQLLELAGGQGPVMPRLNEILEQRATAPPRPELAQQNVMAPSSSIAERLGADGQPQAYADLLETMDPAALRQVASPDNNPGLAQLISDTTGREWDEFTRADIIEGLVEYQQETGQSLLVRDWNQNFRATSDIQVDAQRFQFKQDVNEAGEQIGNSLSGVDRWDTNAEGVIDVWTDPADGITYVVNGHNRLARAQQLGIPTVPIREMPAATAAEARSMGAMANIKEGRGTVFDAAKFMRDSGITDVEQLQRMGAPLSDGNAARGLALSKLPDNLFQDAVDGRLSIGKAAALGGSGLDETQMQAAARALARKDMSDAAFNEVVQQVRSAPVMETGQVDLFGNSETLSLMTQKAELVTRIRSDLISEKNLFGRTARGAGRLERGGNVIDVQGSQQVAADAQAVLAMFDQVKYAPGPVSDLLNDGAQQIAEGAKPAIVAARIRGQVGEAVRASIAEQGIPAPRVDAPAAAEVPAVRTLDPAQRQELQLEAIRRSVSEAEVRPPESPIPELPDGPAVTPRAARADIEARAGELQPGTPAAQAMADEIRLAGEYFEQDARLRAVAEQGARDATNYELLTFDQKKAQGLADGYDLMPPGTALTHGTSRGAAESIMAGGFRQSRAADGGALMGDGVYMTPNARYAGAYGDTAVGGRLPDDARILDLVAEGRNASDFAESIGVGRPAGEADGEVFFTVKQQRQIKEWASKNGYDGIQFDPVLDQVGEGIPEVVIYNTDLANRMVGSEAALQRPVRPEPMRLADGDAPTAPARTKKADLEARKQIDANNQRMDEIRRKAQQEGC